MRPVNTVRYIRQDTTLTWMEYSQGLLDARNVVS